MVVHVVPVPLFEFDDLVELPDWAHDCFSCKPATFDADRHFAEHLPVTCMICGTTERNRLQAHSINLGGSRELGALVCDWLHYRINNARYLIKHGGELTDRMRDVVACGWTFTPAAEPLVPAGWPLLGGMALDNVPAVDAGLPDEWPRAGERGS